MLFESGSTENSLDLRIVDDVGLPVTGLVAATFPALTYSLAGPNADVAFPSLADLATITTAWAAGGVKERGGGVYRVDAPNAMFATAGIVTVRGEETGKRVICDVIEVQQAAAGSGPRTVTITVNDGATVLQNASVRLAEGVNNYFGATNVSGVVTFGVLANDATYSVVISKAGYSFTPTTLLVDGDETQTYSMTAVVLAPAADPGKCNLYITCYGADTEVESGVVISYQQVAIPSGDTGRSFDQQTRTVTSNVSGVAIITAIRLAEYDVWRGSGQKSRVTIADASTMTKTSFLGAEIV